MAPTPSQDPPIPQGGGGLMGYDHDHGRGGGGGTRNLEHICIYHLPPIKGTRNSYWEEIPMTFSNTLDPQAERYIYQSMDDFVYGKM